MKYAAHGYQVYATNKIIEQKACGLFLEMGMGKTVAALTAAAELLYDRFEVERVLVIAPLRVAEDTWSRECEKWDHLRFLRIAKILGTEKERVRAVRTSADLYVINRENVEWLVGFHGKNWPYDMVIIDELSSFKSAKSKRFKALRKVRPLVSRIVGLTGTPAPNGLVDLWPQLYLLDQGERLGKTMTGFRERYFLPDKRSRSVIFSYKPKPDAEEAIYRRISGICVSMKAHDFLEMPQRIDNVVPVKLSNAESAQYDELEREALLHFPEGDIDAANAAALSNKLLQMANGAVYDENGGVKMIHDRKLQALEDVWESANGKPLLVFYAYKHDKDRLKIFFEQRGITPQPLDSSSDIAAWNEGRILVAVVHPASAGHGLNLQAGGNIIVWFGLTWSLELYQQANARLWRQGQQETVIIHHLVAKDTIDETVMAALAKKENVQAALMSAVKAKGGRVTA